MPRRPHLRQQRAQFVDETTPLRHRHVFVTDEVLATQRATQRMLRMAAKRIAINFPRVIGECLSYLLTGAEREVSDLFHRGLDAHALAAVEARDAPALSERLYQPLSTSSTIFAVSSAITV